MSCYLSNTHSYTVAERVYRLVKQKERSFVHARKRLSSSSLIQEDDLQATEWEKNIIQLSAAGKRKDELVLTYLVFIGIKETAILLVASAAGTTSM
jgi:hypothetical protein